MGDPDREGGEMMKILKSVKLSLLMILILAGSAFAQVTPGGKLWLSTYFELQEYKMELEQEIKKIDLKIAQNEQRIRELNELLAKIQKAMIIGSEEQKHNAQKAKTKAEEALTLSEENRKKFKEEKMKYEWLITMIKEQEKKLQELQAKIEANNNIAGLIKECSGTVKIVDSRGKELKDACSFGAQINDGATITTSSDGKVELKILSGQGNFILGLNSKVKVTKTSPNEDNFELIQGETRVKIEKTNEYSNKLKRYLESYIEDLRIVKNWTEEKIKEYQKELEKLFSYRGNQKFNIKTITAVAGVRGTEFVMSVDESGITKVYVIDGEVEVTHIAENKTYSVTQGYKAIIDKKTLTMIKIKNF